MRSSEHTDAILGLDELLCLGGAVFEDPRGEGECREVHFEWIVVVCTDVLKEWIINKSLI